MAGEREQGTLEPLLTTPIRQQEFIVGKAAAVLIPTMALSYAVFGLFLAAVALFANPARRHRRLPPGPGAAGPVPPGAPAGGLVHRGRHGRVGPGERGPGGPAAGDAGQLPAARVVLLLAVGVIHPTFNVALVFAVGLLVIDLRALRIVSRMFDRERLVTGARAVRS